MIGDRIKALRDAHGWSQAHLADAAGVSTRTVQRMEADHRYSGETAMAIAAALEVPVAELVAPSAAAPGEHRPLWRAPTPPRAAHVALALTAPGALFIVVNSLDQSGVAHAPYESLARLGSQLGLAQPFLQFWTVPLIILPLAALALVVMSLLRVNGRVEGQAVSVTGIEFRWNGLAVAAALLAVATFVAPLGNLTADALGHAIRSSD